GAHGRATGSDARELLRARPGRKRTRPALADLDAARPEGDDDDVGDADGGGAPEHRCQARGERARDVRIETAGAEPAMRREQLRDAAGLDASLQRVREQRAEDAHAERAAEHARPDADRRDDAA